MTIVNYSVQDINMGSRPARICLHGAVLPPCCKTKNCMAPCSARSAFRWRCWPLRFRWHLACPVHARQRLARRSKLVIIALSLLIPWNVVGHHLAGVRPHRHRPVGQRPCRLGVDYNYTGNDVDAWVTVLVMDGTDAAAALLCWRACALIPDAYCHQAARIDGASRLAVFRYIQLPKMRGVLMITSSCCASWTAS